MDTAAEILATSIKADEKNKIARFLEGQGYKEMALEVATDPEHRFDLALALGNLPIALDIARDADVEHRWKTVGDAAMGAWDLKLAEECFGNAHDLGSLLLLATATNDAAALRKLATQADEAGSHNIAFSCLWYLADVEGCLDLLLRTQRNGEAVLFAQTYRPRRCREVVGVWKRRLEKGGKGKVSRMLGVPPAKGEDEGDEELFPEWDEYLRLETEGKNGVLVDVAEAGEEDGATAADGNAEAKEEDGEAADEVEAAG